MAGRGGGRDGRPERGSGPERGPVRIGAMVPRVLEELGLGETSRAVRLLAVWEDALGPGLAPHCRPQGIRHGVLQVTVRDSAWMQRLQLEKPTILARLEQALGEPAAGDIRFRVGAVDDRGPI